MKKQILLSMGFFVLLVAAMSNMVTAQAKERDTFASDKIRSLLYDPETGFASLKGQNAVSKRKAVLDEIELVRKMSSEGLSRAARLKLENSINQRVETAKNSIEKHTLSERQTWLDGASSAREESAFQDAIIDPTQTAASLVRIEGEIGFKASQNGWDAARTSEEIEKATSALYTEQVKRIANTDPIAAAEYMREQGKNLTGSDALTLETMLQPEIKKATGRAMGREAYLGIQSGGGSNYREAIAAVESAGSGDYAAIGRVIESGSYMGDRAYGRYQIMGGNIPQWSREALGREVSIEEFMAKPEIQDAIFNHRFGVLVAKYGNPQDAASAWFTGQPLSVGGGRSDGNIDGNEYVRRFNAALGAPDGEAGGIESLIAIDDPDIRAAAISEFKLISGVEAARTKAQRDAASDQVFRHIEAGGSVDDIDLSSRSNIGRESMSALRSYEAKKKSGTPIVTDNKTYYDLKKMQSEDPERFRSLNLYDYVDKLDSTDWQGLVDQQQKPISDITRNAASTLMTTAARHMKDVGIDKDEGKVAALQTELLKWQEEYVAKNGTTPGPFEIDQQVGRALSRITIDPDGLFNKVKGYQFEIGGFDIGPDKLATSSITIGTNSGDIDIPASVINEQIAALKAAGIEVTPATLMNEITSMLQSRGIY